VPEQNADVSLRRQRAPEASHRWALGLFLGRFAERRGADVAGVHSFIEQIDGFPLAGAVHAADQDHDRETPVLEQVVLRIE
jgi:hypothetical protein